MIRRLVLAFALLFGFLQARLAYGAAQLIPEHQHRLGTCPGGTACQWDCAGAQCEFGFGQPICTDDAECGSFFCEAGPICDDGISRSPCTLPVLDAFTGHLVVRVDENDALCAPVGQGCNQSDAFDECGSKITLGLRGRRQDGSATEFALSKDVDLCATPAVACSSNSDCSQCLADGFGCPRTDPVLLCNGQGDNDIRESDLELFADFATWLNDMQPLAFLRSDLPAELQQGTPVVVRANQTSFEQRCTGGGTCTDDADCPAGESCFAEAEFCVTIALVRGRCVGGPDAGTLCSSDGECDEADCAIPGAPDISTLVSDDTDISVADMGSCGDFACGDGMRDPLEACDDGNVASGDGCSSGCAVEPCFTCAGEPSSCTRVDGSVDGDCSCGDGNVDSGEECGEDGLPSCASDFLCLGCRCRQRGDCALNGGGVDLFDVLAQIDIVLARTTPDAVEQVVCDDDCNGKVDLFDVLTGIDVVLGGRLLPLLCPTS